MGAVNHAWDNHKTEFYHELNCPAGRYRFELWDDGWRMYHKSFTGQTEILKIQMTDDEMMGAIKLLRS